MLASETEAAVRSRRERLEVERANSMTEVRNQSISTPEPTPYQAGGMRPAQDTPGDLSQAAAGQQKLLVAQNAARARELETQRKLRALNERTTQLFTKLYEAAKQANIRFAAIEPELASINVGRRTSGVWELRAGDRIDGDRYLMVVDFLRQRPTFAVEGIGLVSADGYLRDSLFESTGIFEESCAYEIYVGSRSIGRYPCQQFLDGSLDVNVLADMKKAFTLQVAPPTAGDRK